MRNLSILVIVVLVVFSLISTASAARLTGKAQIAWFITLQPVDVNGVPVGSAITLGASDSTRDIGRGQASQNYVGIHLGMGDQGQTGYDVVAGWRTKVVRDIYIWSDNPLIKVAYIHWYTSGCNYSQNILYSAAYWPHVLYSLETFGISDGVNLPKEDFSKGWGGTITFSNMVPTAWNQGQVLRINCNPPRN